MPGRAGRICGARRVRAPTAKQLADAHCGGTASVRRRAWRRAEYAIRAECTGAARATGAATMASLFRSGHKAKSQRNGYGLDEPGKVQACCSCHQTWRVKFVVRDGLVAVAAGVGIVFKSGPDEALFVKVGAWSGRALVASAGHVLWTDV